jgi:hypothetical protein
VTATVNAESFVATTASGFVTVIERTPVNAVEATVTLARTRVESTNEVTALVMPVPNTATFAPSAKFAPVTSIVVVRPLMMDEGVTASINGAGVTVKPLTMAAVPPSGLMTVTSRSPGAAVAATDNINVSSVGLTYVRDWTVIPVPEKPMIDPLTNPLPITLMVRQRAPWPSRRGDNDDRLTGAGGGGGGGTVRNGPLIS